MTERSQALARVRRFLHEAGVPDEEIDRAEADDLLDLLVADRVLVPAERRYDEKEVSERSGMPVDMARRFWRALGFSDVGPDDRVFTDLDVEAIVILREMLAMGVVDLASAIQLARVIGSSMARIADAEVSPALAGAGPVGPIAGDSVISADLFVGSADRTLPAMAKLLEFAWRRHVQAATRRAMLLRNRAAGALPVLSVGFADMVGFTLLTQQLAEDELAVVVSRFEAVAHDVITAGGGRLVKMIGDEAMFVSDSPLAAVRIALGLAEAYSEDELLSDVRVGLAIGPVLVQDGDYYGPVVNLAHAIVALADPGSVLLSDELHAAVTRELHPSGGPPHAGDVLTSDAEFAFRAVRPRHVKDLGRVQVWTLRRPGAPVRSFDRHSGRGWDRLAEIVRDLDDLRDRGERLLSEGLRAAVRETASSSPGQPDGGDAEGTKHEAPVDRLEGAAPQVDEPT